MFSLICAWINDWVNNRVAGDLRRHRTHYDVTVMRELYLLNTCYMVTISEDLSHVYVVFCRCQCPWNKYSGLVSYTYRPICNTWLSASRVKEACILLPLLFDINSWPLDNDVIMSTMASQNTILTIVYSTVYSGTDQRKHESSSSLAFVRGIHRCPVNSPHKWPVTRKMFPFDDVFMKM